MSPLRRRVTQESLLESARGALAIDAHVARTDGGPPARWYHPRPSRSFTGPGPVEMVTLHRLSNPDHWHLVTYGLSELHGKERPHRERSGWGFELTIRVASDTEDPDKAPLWAVDFLASLAAYVWSGRHPFAAGHLMDLRGPIRLGSASNVTAALIVQDPVLGTLEGPYGSVEFLQVVGLTAEELELCRSWSAEGVRELMAREDPLMVTRLYRRPITADPRWSGEIEQRSRTEGSDMHELRIATLRWKRGRGAVVEMGAGAAAALGPALRRELVGQGAQFAVIGDEGEVRFVIGAEPGWRWTEDGMEITVPLDDVDLVASLFTGRTGWGRLAGWAGLRFHVLR